MSDLINEYTKSGLISDPTRHFRSCYFCNNRFHLDDLNDVDCEIHGGHDTILVCDECKTTNEQRCATVSDTPETDAVFANALGRSTATAYNELLTIARRLERERDALRTELSTITATAQDLCQSIVDHYHPQADENGWTVGSEIRLILDQISNAVSELPTWRIVAEMQGERDALRSQVAVLREALDSIVNMPDYDQDNEHRLRHIARAVLNSTAPPK